MFFFFRRNNTTNTVGVGQSNRIATTRCHGNDVASSRCQGSAVARCQAAYITETAAHVVQRGAALGQHRARPDATECEQQDVAAVARHYDTVARQRRTPAHHCQPADAQSVALIVLLRVLKCLFVVVALSPRERSSTMNMPVPVRCCIKINTHFYSISRY